MGKRKGRLSAGSVLMLALTVLVLLGSALVLLRLKSGTVRPVVRTDVEALTGIGGRETEPEAESAEAPRTEQSAPPGQAAAREPAAQPTAGTGAWPSGSLAGSRPITMACSSTVTSRTPSSSISFASSRASSHWPGVLGITADSGLLWVATAA